MKTQKRIFKKRTNRIEEIDKIIKSVQNVICVIDVIVARVHLKSKSRHNSKFLYANL